MRTTAAKRDANEREIIQALHDIGACVQPLSAKGVPDLLVGYRGRNYLLEVKAPKGHLTEDQMQWIEGWLGEVLIVRSVMEAYDAIGVEVLP